MEHTDEASLALLKAFVSENLTISNAIARVMNEVGPDEAYGSKLEYYPKEAGDLQLNPIFSE